MKRIFSFFRRRRRIATGPVPAMLGQSIPLPLALKVLAETKADAMRARRNNYRRSVRRILDAAKN